MEHIFNTSTHEAQAGRRLSVRWRLEGLHRVPGQLRLPTETSFLKQNYVTETSKTTLLVRGACAHPTQIERLGCLGYLLLLYVASVQFLPPAWQLTNLQSHKRPVSGDLILSSEHTFIHVYTHTCIPAKHSYILKTNSIIDS